MKKGFAGKINSEVIKHLFEAIVNWLRDLLLHHSRIVAAILFFLVIIAGLWLAASAMIWSQQVATDETPTRELSTGTIDRLEFWIEERQRAYENPPTIPSAAFN